MFGEKRREEFKFTNSYSVSDSVTSLPYRFQIIRLYFQNFLKGVKSISGGKDAIPLIFAESVYVQIVQLVEVCKNICSV